MENKLARFRRTGLTSVFLSLALLLLACGGGDREPSVPLKVILHGPESQSEQLDLARGWLIGKGVDVLYLQTDAKDIYSKTVLAVHATDPKARERLLALTGVEAWIWARQEQPAAPFDLYIGDDIQELMNTY